MLGLLLNALPKKREEWCEKETISKQRKTNRSREDSHPEATGDLMLVH